MDAFKQARTAYIAACASGDAGRIRRARCVLDTAYDAMHERNDRAQRDAARRQA